MPLAEEKDTEIRLLAPGGYSAVDVDARRIRRIVRNLLGNAIEHGEGRPIVVTSTATPTAVAIGVRDYGVGMAADESERVFDRFWRADPSRQRTHRRHRARARDHAGGRDPARRRARGLERARPGQLLPAHASAPPRRAIGQSPLELPPDDAHRAREGGLVRRRWMCGPAALAVLALLAGCASIPTGGGVTTVQVSADDLEDPLPTLPEGPRPDAGPEQIIADFLIAGRGPQDNYAVARQYLTDDFRTTWRPGARVLISSSPIAPNALADNTWSVDISASAAVDGEGRYQSALPADAYDLTFGLIKDGDGQWRINSAPDGTVAPTDSFASIFDSYEVYFFDPSFDYLVPDLRWFRSGSTAVRSIVDAVLAGPSETFGEGALFSAFPAGVRRGDTEPTIDAGVATVSLSSGAAAGSTTTHRRMEQQLLQSLRSVASVRDVEIEVDGFQLQIPDGGRRPRARSWSATTGGRRGRPCRRATSQGVTAISGIGRSADAVGATAGSIVADDRASIALLGPGGVSWCRRARLRY